ncbi:MAG: DUF2804 domain-containing protein [Peptococcaceae bacterium]|nr:DUF2804 domain-containing protein [Peptococcaceae bacterium]MBQ5862203.1 DUF2804 domain-containing protein [Peptococcaceae bacterium]
MMEHVLTKGPLLDAQGQLTEAGYATSLVKTYRRSDIKASGFRIKEWDYYLIYNDRFGIALTLDDNSYMSMLSASILDFTTPSELTVSPIGVMPMGKTNLPSTSESGVSRLKIGKSEFTFTVGQGKRRLTCYLDKFKDGKPFEADILLYDEPQDSMVIATPFAEDKKAFYYNQKIVGMRAKGTVKIGAEEYVFDPAESFGLLDWGRGVWTRDNTWYWGAGHGMVDGHVVGFNIGYGFGDTSAASENMIFVDGIAHKFDKITFNIPQTSDGKDDFMKPWTFTSSDGRFEMDFEPIMDRASCTDLKVIISDQHQVFGKFTGKMILDDGSVVELKDFLGFAEKVRNKW